MTRLRQEYEDLSRRTQNPTLEINNVEVQYQSHWLNTAIHLLTSIPSFQNIEKMAEKLQLSQNLISPHLKFLTDCGYIENKGKQYIYKTGAGHTPKKSPLTWIHHQNWRQLAVQDSCRFDSSGVHYTLVQTLSMEDFDRLKNLILDIISKVNQIADPSKPEEMMIFNCDFFNLGTLNSAK